MDDDISDDIECAKQIHSLKGFKNWKETWANCNSSGLGTYLEECDFANDLMTAASSNNPENVRAINHI